LQNFEPTKSVAEHPVDGSFIKETLMLGLFWEVSMGMRFIFARQIAKMKA